MYDSIWLALGGSWWTSILEALDLIAGRSDGPVTRMYGMRATLDVLNLQGNNVKKNKRVPLGLEPRSLVTNALVRASLPLEWLFHLFIIQLQLNIK